MFDTENRTTLPLASSAGCSCCAPSGHAPEVQAAVVHSDAGAAAQRTFAVEGLTCGHCVQTVEKAVSALDGVESACVDLVPGGRSGLTVAGSVTDAAIRQAVTSAGYSLASN
ncbi:heavy-metal-associated domain-containing protein [Pseudarthrobacter sp. NamB4]|uniref:heavy-metal-associated domain-containing protein n=1 Tax=Pseudarthrobacter sp. NamB4 TaxID=2576837 RepID=UPI0010FEFF4A|nr:heavy-metal-associated domain-containing protein [Pseudarthrobacter sp. NamB4]TLM72899.1 heavy-metal-associated domain-containing protein [Pseudarthrobacter sp. NamB4]